MELRNGHPNEAWARYDRIKWIVAILLLLLLVILWLLGYGPGGKNCVACRTRTPPVAAAAVPIATTPPVAAVAPAAAQAAAETAAGPEECITISAADPLNLTGVLFPGARIPAVQTRWPSAHTPAPEVPGGPV